LVGKQLSQISELPQLGFIYYTLSPLDCGLQLSASCAATVNTNQCKSVSQQIHTIVADQYIYIA